MYIESALILLTNDSSSAISTRLPGKFIDYIFQYNVPRHYCELCCCPLPFFKTWLMLILTFKLWKSLSWLPVHQTSSIIGSKTFLPFCTSLLPSLSHFTSFFISFSSKPLFHKRVPCAFHPSLLCISPFLGGLRDVIWGERPQMRYPRHFIRQQRRAIIEVGCTSLCQLAYDARRALQHHMDNKPLVHDDGCGLIAIRTAFVLNEIRSNSYPYHAVPVTDYPSPTLRDILTSGAHAWEGQSIMHLELERFFQHLPAFRPAAEELSQNCSVQRKSQCTRRHLRFQWGSLHLHQHLTHLWSDRQHSSSST